MTPGLVDRGGVAGGLGLRTLTPTLTPTLPLTLTLTLTKGGTITLPLFAVEDDCDDVEAFTFSYEFQAP